MAIQSVNPATGEVVEVSNRRLTHDRAGRGGAHAAFLEWRRVPFAERAVPMREAGRLLRARKAEYARTMTLEMGKPITQGEAEVEKCARPATTTPSTRRPSSPSSRARPTPPGATSRFDPLGVVLAVMPWNFPFWQVFRFAAPALMAGNGGVLKHASNVPRCALADRGGVPRRGLPPRISSAPC